MSAVAAHRPRLAADIAAVILSVEVRGGRHHGVAATAGSIGACAAVIGLLAVNHESPSRAARDVSVPSDPIEISLDVPVVPASFPPLKEPERELEPSPSPSPSLSPSRSRSERRVPGRYDERAPPPAAGEAASVVSHERAPSAPIDMTGETFVVGSARAYAGGVAESESKSTAPGRGRASLSGTATTAGGDGSVSRGGEGSAPVRLASQSWSCAWPSDADPLTINEETVVIRVLVRADGSVESVTVLSDPGHGFGAAAATCAMRTPFTPARAEDGRPKRAVSAPIRVRFTRH